MDSVLGRGKCACVQKPIIETLVRDADTNPDRDSGSMGVAHTHHDKDFC